MIKPVITICLLFSLLFMVGGITATIKMPPLSEKQLDKKQKRVRSPKPTAAVRPIRFYPVPPATLPDLKKGYLFNEERSLGSKQKNGDGQQIVVVDVKDVFYVGSVITGETRKGLVSYPTSKKKSTGVSTKRSARASDTEQILLKLGDSLGGYEVTDVQADKIVFKKDSEIIEKILNDPDKKRITPPKNTSKKPAARKAVSSQPQTTKSTRTSRPAQRKNVTTSRTRNRSSSSTTTPTNRARRMTPEELRELDREFGKVR